MVQNTQKTPLNEYRTQRVLPYAQATALPAEYVTKEKAAGRIAAENVGFFPPCYPIVTAGEVLNDKAVCALAKAENTFGLKGGLFKVVKERK